MKELIAFFIFIQALANSFDNNPHWVRLDPFRNFSDSAVTITGLPENVKETDMVIFDVLQVSVLQKNRLDCLFGESIGPILMPRDWGLSEYYCCGRIRLIDGVESYLVYVTNYCRAPLPSLYLINIKDNVLRSVLILSRYEEAADFHFYTSYKGGIITFYLADYGIEEDMSIIKDSHILDDPDTEIARSYSEVERIRIDSSGFFHKIVR